MKAICIDISGRVYKYDDALFSAIMNAAGNEYEIIYDKDGSHYGIPGLNVTQK